MRRSSWSEPPPKELAQLKTQVASRETFARYGLDYPPIPGSVTVEAADAAPTAGASSSVRSAGGRHRAVRAPAARSELGRAASLCASTPCCSILLSTRLVRLPATLLPYRHQSRMKVRAHGAISRPAEPSASAQESEPPPSEPSTSQPSSTSYYPAPAAAVGSTRIVRRGDTLSGIANEIAGSDTRSSRKWMVAIYRGNSRAFDGNMNILRSGAELQIPDIVHGRRRSPPAKPRPRFNSNTPPGAALPPRRMNRATQASFASFLRLPTRLLLEPGRHRPPAAIQPCKGACASWKPSCRSRAV